MWRWTGYTSYLARVFDKVSFWTGKPSKECESCRWERQVRQVRQVRSDMCGIDNFFYLKKKTNSMQVKMSVKKNNTVIWTRNEINQGREIRSPALKRVDKWTIVRKLEMFILRRCPVLFSLVCLLFWFTETSWKGTFYWNGFPRTGCHLHSKYMKDS